MMFFVVDMYINFCLLKGWCVIISGGIIGIGCVIVMLLVLEGCKVFICGWCDDYLYEVLVDICLVGEGDGIIIEFVDFDNVCVFFDVGEVYLGGFDIVVINVVVFVCGLM